MTEPTTPDYKTTLNLPVTDFPMRAGLPEREPVQVERWLKDKIYHRMIEKNKAAGGARYLLHDGPPYANGNIHIGHTLNKVLKDVVVKYKNMSGFVSEYIPGWDCHGLPIELGVEKQLRDAKREKSTVPVVEQRALCREYAQKYIDLQSSQFQRLEVFGEWQNPYRTMSQEYVAQIVRELGNCAKTGALYRGNKAVLWCPSCATALAEAEIEYSDKKSPSIYVKFDLVGQARKPFEQYGASRVALVIWTTTPWTLPANLGVALHPEFDYVALEVAPTPDAPSEIWVVAAERVSALEAAAGVKGKILTTFKGKTLDRLAARHPFIERDSLIVLGDHVTLEAGTGAVHTAPGHGAEDYQVGLQYGLKAYSPVDGRGKYTADFAPMQGQFVFKANEPVIELLKTTSSLVARTDITHSYPHCWRCHNPVIYRATPQWFIGMDNGLRTQAINIIKQVEWIPEWGINRILGMVEARPDWCISRQRVWGVPITVFYCESCDEAHATADVFYHVSNIIKERGPDVWFTDPVDALLPPGSQCPKCKSTKFRKETDILDVWFDSGVSHAAVCELRGLGWPADLYLEGSDQHRGWFQTSLLTAVATRGKAPFKAVLTHGFVNDKDGKKMSKSQGNVTSPLDIMKSHGAEILRLWVVFEDYRSDVSFSKESLDRVSESYRKIRNTLRFMLGNLNGFDPAKNAVSLEKFSALDRWAVSRVGAELAQIQSAYDKFEFHRVYHILNNLCTVELSSLYFDILKDRLYTAGKESNERRSSQTALYWIADAVIRAVAPILSFTAEEAYGFLPAGTGKAESVFLAGFPDSAGILKKWSAPEVEKQFAALWEMREKTQKALEEARTAKKIGHPREARLVLTVDGAGFDLLKSIPEDLSRLFLVSQLELNKGSEFEVRVELAEGEKCARCWVYSKAVGQDAKHPAICDRCVSSL